MPEDIFGGLLDDFLLDARERADRAEELLLSLEKAAPERRKLILDEAKRELHTIKGNSGMVGLPQLQALAHSLEDRVVEIAEGGGDLAAVLAGLDDLRALLEAAAAKGEGAPAEKDEAARRPVGDASVQASVRVPFEALDELVDLLAEMVIFKNRLADSISRGRHAESETRAWDEVEASHEALSKTLMFIQDRIMQLRMVPLKTLFGHLRRIVHDEGEREGKQVSFEALGGDTPMDKALLEVASEALGHLVRNAVVHGVETPAVRRAAGKGAGGTVRLAALAHANEVEIVVEDNGAGIDRRALQAKARERDMEVVDESDLYSLLFQAGISTRGDADLGAGRGMGLYAALQSVQRLGGRIEVLSEEGVSTRFSLHLPLSVSIMPALLVAADREEYALPLSSVVESFKLGETDGHIVNHAGVMTWREQVIPLLDLGFVFGTGGTLRRAGYVVVIGAEGRYRGLITDDVTGIREIVVKGLDSLVGSPRGISGSTILGDGRVILILDPLGLMGLKPFVETAVESAHGNGGPDNKRPSASA